MQESKTFKSFAVLGLGRFGMSVVQTLADYDVNVLACDRSEARAHEAAPYATHVVQAEIADEATLEQLELGSYDVVIIAMAEEFEPSLIATMIAREAGAQHIIVKARNVRQKKIFESLGASEVILPEHEMGAKIARKLAGRNIMDILDESDLYTIAEIKPLPHWIGRSIRQCDIRRKDHMLILAARQNERLIVPVSPDYVISANDVLIALEAHGGKQP